MSKSLRISDALFNSAIASGEVFSRSAAQQVEHWARLGKAIEDAGLTVKSATELLGTRSDGPMWAHKRKLQRRDIAMLESGRTRQEDMSLFTVDAVRKAKVRNGPY